MPKSEIKISPPGSMRFNLAELWEHRELLYFFAWRDIKVKYKQTYLGILWALLQPLLLMAVFYIVFSRTLRVDVHMDYPVYVFSGLIIWGLFSSGITHSSESLLGNSAMIRKIYFPRLLVPLSSLLTALVDFLVAFILFIVLLFIWGQQVQWSIIVFFPMAILLCCTASFGIGTLLAALNVKYRDFRYLLPFALQMLFFSAQVVYSLETVQPSWLQQLLYLNPVNGALELFHAPLRDNGYNMTGVAISLLVAVAVLFVGLFYFKKTEFYFADLI